ncbi:MAG: peptide chain release factor N(5)-glutamine methyltransferase [Lachnospiraceae bacterium]|nr:peptide chain release factor N(5)-glutamine methyltransferase [Lachnospiraceae bacterium]
MTYQQAYQNCIELFHASGIEDAEPDARLLLQSIIGKNRAYLLAHKDEELTERQQQTLELLSEKRAGHVPLQLLLGNTDFMGLEFHVSRDVLIPRIDTEFVVEEAMRYVEDGARVLDLCTGSGCILLSLMKYKNYIEGLGVDISDAALALARENAELLGLSQAEFRKSNMFENVDGVFDYILCNPPYIQSAVIPTLMDEVRLHEPHLALDGGTDGLDFYRILAAESASHLTREGMCFFEIGYDQGEAVKALMEEAGYLDIEVLPDYSGKDRVLKCRSPR